MTTDRISFASAGAVRRPYISTAAKQFAPGNFVTDGTTDKVGVTLTIKDPSEANPRVQVRWVRDLTVEWVRSEHLYSADAP
jgi:hypothetical protein